MPWSSWNTNRCKPCIKKSSRNHKPRPQKRTRWVDELEEHGGKPCTDKDGKIITDYDFDETEKKPCQSPTCPAKAAEPYWSNWEDWGPCEEAPGKECDEEANAGTRKRTRNCQIGRDEWNNRKKLRSVDCKKKGLHGTSMEEEQCDPPCGSYSKYKMSNFL